VEFNAESIQMRKANKEITEKLEIERIIKTSKVCRIAVCKNNIPYIIPVFFGYENQSLYVHTALAGRKIEFWESNPLVCIEFESDVHIIGHNQHACKWTASYKSVIAYGQIRELTSEDEKKFALNAIMLNYSDKNWDFPEHELKVVRVWKIEIMEMKGKKSGIM
jgi:uncharacterized protein